VDASAAHPYKRRQRRRAAIAWGTFAVIVLLVVAQIAFGGDGKKSDPGPTIHLFTYEMSSLQYKQLHKGEGKLDVLKEVGSVGLSEGEVDEDTVLRLFPPPATGTSCNFWKLSDAPDHLVRLCFGGGGGSLVEKSVRAPGEGGAESTLA
jgi:hypothetical protein